MDPLADLVKIGSGMVIGWFSNVLNHRRAAQNARREFCIRIRAIKLRFDKEDDWKVWESSKSQVESEFDLVILSIRKSSRIRFTRAWADYCSEKARHNHKSMFTEIWQGEAQKDADPRTLKERLTADLQEMIDCAS